MILLLRDKTLAGNSLFQPKKIPSTIQPNNTVNVFSPSHRYKQGLTQKANECQIVWISVFNFYILTGIAE